MPSFHPNNTNDNMLSWPIAPSGFRIRQENAKRMLPLVFPPTYHQPEDYATEISILVKDSWLHSEALPIDSSRIFWYNCVSKTRRSTYIVRKQEDVSLHVNRPYSG